MVTRKKITTPSGIELTIRRVCVADFMSAGEVPGVIGKDSPVSQQRPPSSKDTERGLAVHRLMLVNCTSKTWKVPGEDGVARPLKITTARFDDCSDDELSVDEIPPTDANFIIGEINAISNQDQKAVEAAKPFSAEQAPASGA